VIPHGIGMRDECLLIKPRYVAKAEEPPRVPKVALIGGTFGAREDGRLAPVAERPQHGRARIGIIGFRRRARGSDAEANLVGAVPDDIVEKGPEDSRDRGVDPHARNIAWSGSALASARRGGGRKTKGGEKRDAKSG
jgi:hypothetical protein